MAAQVTKPVAGATIFDPQGAAIGTIETVTADAVVVNTGTNKVALPPAAIGSNEKGLVASTTKADLDAAAANANAEAQARHQALLTAGTAVKSSDGQPVGKTGRANVRTPVHNAPPLSRRLLAIKTNTHAFDS